MRFAVETWAPEFGAATDGTGLEATDAEVDVAVELAPADWTPIDPMAQGRLAFGSVLFVDGVQRVDARVWIIPEPAPGANGNGAGPIHRPAQLGVCASWAAGAVRCDDTARVVAAQVRRATLCPGGSADPALEPIVTRHGTYEPRTIRSDVRGDATHEALGQARGDLEARVAIEAAHDSPVDLVVVDGPLGDRRHIPGALGYIKAHQVAYLPPAQQSVITALDCGQRTPLFRIGGHRYRYSWYLRLPGPVSHPTWGVVRCELPGELPLSEAIVMADRASVTLPRFATRPHQDPRAPQNLHPIAGLERDLRRRMGDPALLERALRRAAATPN